jgi:hypothetical protein
MQHKPLWGRHLIPVFYADPIMDPAFQGLGVEFNSFCQSPEDIEDGLGHNGFHSTANPFALRVHDLIARVQHVVAIAALQS